MSFQERLKTYAAYIIAAIGMYVSLNSVLAIPLLDENKTQLKEMGNSLKEDLNASKLTFINHLNDFKYDSIINGRFDSASKKLGINSSAQSISFILSTKINNYKRAFDNGSDLVYFDFIAMNSSNNISELFAIKNRLEELFKLKTDSAEKELALYLNAVRMNINRFYSLAKSGADIKSVVDGYSEVFRTLNVDNLPLGFSDTVFVKSRKDPFNDFFYISNAIVTQGSSSVNLIVGIFGVALFGCVIGAYRRNTIAQVIMHPLAIDIGPLLFKSFSASLLTFLSIKSGISFIAVDKGVDINPYFIMLVCFSAAVFSEEIWVWARTKLVPGTTPPPPADAPGKNTKKE